MRQDYRDALILATERGMAKPQGVCAMYNATALSGIGAGWSHVLQCEQGFRPEYLRLENSGNSVVPVFADDLNADQAIVLLGRNRKVNEANVARAWNTCVPGGQIIVAGDKKAGVASLRKWASDRANVLDSFSKHHAMVFRIDREGHSWELPNMSHTSMGYQIADGMFSSDGPDKASQLLVEHFDSRIGGPVADLGAGWGYLSNELLKRSHKVTALDLFEADFNSLEVSKNNVCINAEEKVAYHWCDVTSEFRKKPYQWVIMNPPFHSAGRAAEPELGKRFIEVAASTLPSGGRLLMVANKNLPYEKTLGERFRRFEKLSERDGFKVIEAMK